MSYPTIEQVLNAIQNAQDGVANARNYLDIARKYAETVAGFDPGYIDRVRAEERERCARAIEERGPECVCGTGYPADHDGVCFAARIRGLR